MVANRSAQKTRHQGVQNVIRGNSYRPARAPGGGFCDTRSSGFTRLGKTYMSIISTFWHTIVISTIGVLSLFSHGTPPPSQPITYPASVVTIQNVSTTTPEIKESNPLPVVPVSVPKTPRTNIIPPPSLPPPNTILCNGTCWDACPTGQNLVCPTDGAKAYCTTPKATALTNNAQSIQTPPSSGTTLPSPSAAEIQDVTYLCSIPQMASQCSPTFWSGYETNAIFRNNIDAISQQLQQKLAQQSAAQANCLQSSKQAYDPSVGPEANLYAQQMALYACGIGPAPMPPPIQVTQPPIQVQQTVPTTIQPAQPTRTCTTQPWWNAGVLQFTTTCN